MMANYGPCAIRRFSHKKKIPFLVRNKLLGLYWKNLNINYHSSYSLLVDENEIASHEQTNWQQLSFISQQSRQTFLWSNCSNVHVYLIEGDILAIWCIWHTNCWLKHLIIENVGQSNWSQASILNLRVLAQVFSGRGWRTRHTQPEVEENWQKCALAKVNSWVYLGVIGSAWRTPA